MKNFQGLFLLSVVIIHLYLERAHGKPQDVYVNISSQNNTHLIRRWNHLEVPDSALILLDRIKYMRIPTDRKRTRQEQETETSSSPCDCEDGVCTCCTGYILSLLNQKACMKIMYHPEDFAFDVKMSLNDLVLYENSMSGKNPKPVCISPPRFSNLKLCAKFYNVFFPGRNFHFCSAMMGQWGSTELFYWPFDCLRMGAQGLAMVKPDEGGGLPIANPQGGVDAVVDAGEDDIEDYDENLVKSLLNVFDR